jgi:glycosyltransferase involved in cell wall biosynthesis
VDIEILRDVSVSRPSLIDETWKVVLILARVSRDKRHEILLSAFENVVESFPDTHLICVGSKDMSDPEWWDFLQDQTHQSSFSSQIHWVGQYPDVRPWYHYAHLCVLATENESFGRVLVEAMACGVPVIATNSGGVPEIVRHGKDGFLVTPGSVDEMANAMTVILGDEALRRSLADSARKRSESFALDTHKEKMIKVFQESS